jgi:hypothetical protein
MWASLSETRTGFIRLVRAPSFITSADDRRYEQSTIADSHAVSDRFATLAKNCALHLSARCANVFILSASKPCRLVRWFFGNSNGHQL